MYAIPSLHHASKREVIIAIPNAPPNVDPILKIPDATPTLSGSVVDTAVLNAGVANRPVPAPNSTEAINANTIYCVAFKRYN